MKLITDEQMGREEWLFDIQVSQVDQNNSITTEALYLLIGMIHEFSLIISQVFFHSLIVAFDIEITVFSCYATFGCVVPALHLSTRTWIIIVIRLCII